MANDLQAGDEGVGQGFRRKAAPGPRKGGKGKKRKLANDCGDEWDADAEFEVEAIVGTRTSAGTRAGDVGRKGDTLYKIVWAGWAAETSTWEPAENIHDDILAEYEGALEAEAELEAEEAAELEAEAAADVDMS